MAANVMFKRASTRSKLNDIALVDGNIIVAMDERAMYVDYDTGSAGTPNVQRFRLGDFIEVATVTDLNNLTTSGAVNPNALYYVTGANILCKHDGTNWVQINKQNGISDLIKTLSFNTAATSNVATVTETISDGITTKTTNFKVASKDTDALSVTAETTTPQVNLRVKNVTDEAVLSATAVSGGASINVTTTHKGTSATGAAINTSADGGTVQIVGANGATVEYDSTGKKITVNGTPITSVGESFNADGKHTTSVTAGGATKSGSTTPIIAYGNNKTAVFASGTATLDVYDKTQTQAKIQEALRASDAMVFKGTIGSAPSTATSLPTTNVSIGDAYKVKTPGTYAGQLSKSGDLFIATAADGKDEDANGFLATADIIWVWIPSGDEPSYSVSSTAGTDGTGNFVIKENGTAIGSINPGKDIVYTRSGDVIKVNHKDVTTTENTDTALDFGVASTISFTPIVGVTIDNGHITGFTKKEFKITRNDLNTVSNSVSAASNIATVGTTIAMKSGTSKNTSFKLTSSNLTVTATGTTVAVNLQWEDF